jgi:hypothetical protein
VENETNFTDELQTEFTAEQAAALYDAVCRNQVVRCPFDQAVMTYTKDDSLWDGPMFDIRCPLCQVSREIGPWHDPQRGRYRKWTRAEKRTMVRHIFQHPHGTVRCPLADCGDRVDVSWLDVEDVSFRCGRCGNEHDYSSGW